MISLHPIKLAIVEDNPDLLGQLRESLSYFPEVHISGHYSDCSLLLKDLKTLPLDIIIMDIHLPGISGVECVKLVKTERPDVQVVMWTVFDDDEHILNSILNGADGYILKNSPMDEIIKSILEIKKGGSLMSMAVARKVIDYLKRKNTPSEKLQVLSSREQEVLHFLADGYRYKEIADKLFLSIETVRTHIRNIYSKLQVKSRNEAVKKIFPR